MSKWYYIAAKKKSKQTLKKLQILLEEYISECGRSISLHKFFVEVLNYTEDDFISLCKYIKKREKKKQKKNNTPSIPRAITYGIGNVEHPEYDKYFNLFCEYRKYLNLPNALIEKKCLTDFLKRTYNYSSEEALLEARKVHNILFKKKRDNIDNKLIVKELDNQEYRIVGIV